MSLTDLEIIELGLVHHAVGRGDVEQAVEHMLQRLGRIGEKARDLAGIGVVAGHVLLGEVEHPGHLLFVPGRDFDRRAEGALFGGRHGAVGNRHLGGQRNQRQRKRSVTAARQPGIGVERIGQRTRQPGALAERADKVGQSLPHVGFLFRLAHAMDRQRLLRDSA